MNGAWHVTTPKARYVLALILAASCGGDGPTDPPAGGIDLRVNHRTLEVGDTTQAVTTRTDAAGAPIVSPVVSYASSAGAVATVSAAGVVVARAPGTAVISAVSDGLTDTVSVSVLTPVASITITPVGDSMIIPGGMSLSVTLRDAEGAEVFGRRAHFSTSDPAVATVGEFGDVTAVAPGTVTITARLGPVEGDKVIRVLVAAAEVVINAPPTSLVIEENVQLSATVYDAAGNVLQGRPLAWSHSGVISVTEDGLATARVGGSGTISVAVEGATAQFTIPSLIDGPFVQIGAGHQHSCGLTGAGTAYCWGASEAGQAGQDAAAGFITSPSHIDGLPPVEMLVSRGAHNCGLTDAGVAHCWGLNDFGQLGHAPAATGAPGVAAGAMVFAQLSLGIQFTCGLTSGGAVYCWGDNRWGQLGRGTADENPHPDPALVLGAPAFTSISAGYYTMCGLTAAGAAWCWGANAYGQLGLGTSDPDPHPVPAPAAAGLTFSSLAAGGLETCGITTSSNVYCWGSANLVPSPIDAANTYTRVSSGNEHSCGIRTGGAMQCWGRSGEGQRDFPLVSYDRLAAGGYHNCGREAGGKVICWGSNLDRQLGGPQWESGPVPGQP